jgi:DNA-binding NarL/FixJ family response regulator
MMHTDLTSGTLRILLLGADPEWRQSLRHLMDQHSNWSVCGEIEASDQALELVAAETPDVLATDTSISANALETILESRPSIGVLIFGSPEDEDRVEDLLRAGARGVVAKEDPEETIEEAVEALGRSRLFFSPSASELVFSRFVGRPSEGTRGLARKLTPRERDVVRLLAEGKSNRELAQALDISLKTVENHRSNAMRKLGVRTLGDLVRAAIEAEIIAP